MQKWMMSSLLGWAAVVSAGPVCQKDWACVETEMTADGARVFVHTYSETPLTLTVFLNAHNLDTSKYGVITRVFQHKGRYSLADLQALDRDKPWTVAPRMAAVIGRLDARHNETQLYRLPFQPGQSHTVMQGWDGQFSHHEDAKFCIDFDMPVGTKVLAARGGRVVDVVDDNRIGGPQAHYAKHANYVVILHDDGTTGEYYHLQYGSARVHVGDVVDAGAEIAASGNTGFSSAPHLHFGVYVATDWGRSLSVPAHFIAEDGIHEQLHEGATYTASDHEDLVGRDLIPVLAVND